MRDGIIGGIAALALLAATPVAAQSTLNFTGPRASVYVSEGNTQNAGYGVSAGYDTALNDKWRLGVEADAQDVFEGEDLSAGARLGYTITPTVLGFVSGGVAEVQGNYGARVGAGAEFKINENFFATVEYRHTDFGPADRDQGMVGIGYRF
jgi:opacity protein-like surface antigen